MTDQPRRAHGLLPAALVALVGLACAAPPAARPGPASAPAQAAPDLSPATPSVLAAPTLRPAPVTVRLHTPSESTSTLPITVAQHLGYYAEEAIELDVRPMPPNVGMAALLSGEVHYSSAATSALTAAARGAPVRLVIALADRPSHVLVGAKGMTSPEQLRGGAIASSSPGGVQYRESLAALRHFGLDPQAVTLVSMPNDAVRQAALESGAAQAAVLTVPFNIKLEREGYPRLLNFGEGDLIRVPVGSLSGMSDYLERNEDAVVRMVRATLRGLRAIPANRAATIEALMGFFHIDKETAADVYDAVAPTYTPDGRIPASAIRAALESADESVRDADPDALVDYRYLERATQTLPPAAPGR